MNVQDALGMINEKVEQARETAQILEEVRQFCEETEATLAELLGHDNEEVGKIGAASARAADAQQANGNSLLVLEDLRDILASIL